MMKRVSLMKPSEAANRFTSAYAGLSVSFIFLWCYGFLSREDSIPKAKRAAMQAVEINNKIGKLLPGSIL